MEVEALEGDSELNLVTEVWVEPQYGRVGPGPESWKHLQGLTYSEIPHAVSDFRRTPTPRPIPLGAIPLGIPQLLGFRIHLNVCDCVGFLESWRPGVPGLGGADPRPLLFLP